MNLPRIGLSWALLLSLAPVGWSQDRFAGFPPINKFRKGDRSAKVITSDAITGVVRPKWTRAMTDLGGWPAMYRFKGTIYLHFPHVDGHRGKKFESTGKLLTYASTDEGKTWVAQPAWPQSPQEGTPEYVVAGDKLYSYEFDKNLVMNVRVSEDAKKWSDLQPCYKRPYYFWGVMYDPISREFWAPPHGIPRAKGDPPRQIHLVHSKDGLAWEYVSTVANFANASESVIHFEKDRTMVVLIRRKYGRNHSLAVSRPPYKDWQITENLPNIVEGEHFFEVAGQTFLGSRANYTGDNPDIRGNPKIFDGRKSYTTIYRFQDRKLEPWAVVDSMGDCSYPFLVETPTEVLCAYYSQHEDRVCKVFLAGFDKAAFLKGR